MPVVRFFSQFIDFSKLSADPDQNVKNATILVDRLMKDIVTQSGCFNMESYFINELLNKVYSFAQKTYLCHES